VPAPIAPELAAHAHDIAARIANAFDYVGVLAVEMFVVRDGSDTSVLVNEIAPRVHNSGHWTLDGCSVSQFEQHIRAVAGWPLAVPVRWADVEMINLIGPEVDDYARWLSIPGAALHLYGKDEARPGRKMGHVTRVLHRPARA
jgi:5-(carboxyamino)imidazole ribonucleotide synthase